jgi:hypothetical protein
MVRRNHKFGVDANRPIVVDVGPRLGAPSDTVADPGAIAETGAAWVRLNFVLGPWSGPRDTARFQGRTWAETYAAIIDGFTDRGLNVYGLVGHEAVKPLPDYFRDPKNQMPAGEVAAAQGWLAHYAENVSDIVALFADRVMVFEVFNEPDDWHGAFRPWIHSSWFAEMLEGIYRRVKVQMGIGHVKLISGPLQGLELNENRAPSQYLRETYQYGRQYLGWGQFDRPYPFDGVGYHLYVREGYDPDWNVHENQVRMFYRYYIDGMMRVIRAAEGPDTSRQLYVSEIGWPSNRDTAEEKAFQARNLGLAFDLLQSDPAVALAIWFCTEDYDPGRRHYGLYQMQRVTAEGRKPAFYQFKAFCERFGTGAIHGVLCDQAGNPQSGYQILATGSAFVGSVVTDRDGTFRLDGLPGGSHTLVVAGSAVSQAVTGDGYSEIGVDLVLPLVEPPEQGAISGVLCDHAGVPQAGRQITLGGQDIARSVATDADGHYRFDGLAAGPYDLQVEGDDRTRHVWCNGVTPARLDLTLPAIVSTGEGTVSGTLCDRFGTPEVARRIALVSAVISRSVVTDSNGRYRVESLPAGTYAIHVEGSDLLQSICTDGSTPLSLDLTLPAVAAPGRSVVSGVLRDQAGMPLPGRQVTLELLSARMAGSVDTDDRGMYRFDELPAGTYRLTVSGTDTVRTVWVDGTVPLLVDLMWRAPVTPVGLGSIVGTLHSPKGQPQAGYQVQLRGAGVSISAVTDTDGRYRLEGLPRGTYLVSVPTANVVRYVWSTGQTPVQMDLVTGS